MGEVQSEIPNVVFSQPPLKDLSSRPHKWRTHSSFLLLSLLHRFKAITVVGFLCATPPGPNASVMKSPPPKLTPAALAALMRSILSPFRAGVVKAPKVGEFGSDGGGCAFWMSLSLSLILSLVWMGWYNRIRTGSNADFSHQALPLS